MMHLLGLLIIISAWFHQTNSFLHSYFGQAKLLSLRSLGVGTNLGAGSRAAITHTKTTDNTMNTEHVASSRLSESGSLKYFNIGKVLGAHGVRGDVKMHLSPEYGGLHVKTGSILYMKNATERALCPWTIGRSRVQGSASLGIHIVRFQNIKTRTAAEAFNKCNIYVEEQTIRDKLESNEYMVRDLVGLNCYHIGDFDAIMNEVAVGSDPIAMPEDATHCADFTCHIGKLQPIARVLGVVPPDELCSDPKVAHLMHAQLELQVFPAPSKTVTTPNRAARRKISSINTTNTSAPPPVSTAMSPGGSINCLLMPLVPSIVPVVDLERKLIFLDPPEGLLDLTYKVKDNTKNSDIVSLS